MPKNLRTIFKSVLRIDFSALYWVSLYLELLKRLLLLWYMSDYTPGNRSNDERKISEIYVCSIVYSFIMPHNIYSIDYNLCGIILSHQDFMTVCHVFRNISGDSLLTLSQQHVVATYCCSKHNFIHHNCHL